MGCCLQVVDFNSKHRWRKRGIALMPLRYGISFTSVFMNQSGALVSCCTHLDSKRHLTCSLMVSVTGGHRLACASCAEQDAKSWVCADIIVYGHLNALRPSPWEAATQQADEVSGLFKEIVKPK